jgi:23S rRNA pseudouridine2605 synthase/16S rRNA pseudouridine516 synthase
MMAPMVLIMSTEFDDTGRERLQKVLSRAGVASRRRVEQLMQQGRITVNGNVATELGMRIDAATDIVAVGGKVVSLDVTLRYVMLHKPAGVVSTLSDERGRPDLNQYLEEIGERLFNVGRLDSDTTGLLLLTNDGVTANLLAHPSFEVDKVYVATVTGLVTPSTIKKLLDGVELEDGVSAADKARVVGTPQQGKSIVELVMHSGKNRIVRRMLDALGHPVIDLHRRSFGPLHLGGLKAGHWRDLTRLEVTSVLTLAHQEDNSAKEHPHDTNT